MYMYKEWINENNINANDVKGDNYRNYDLYDNIHYYTQITHLCRPLLLE